MFLWRLERNFSGSADPKTAGRWILRTSPKLSLCTTLQLCEIPCLKGIKTQLSPSADNKPSGSVRKEMGCNRVVRLRFESAPLLMCPASCSSGTSLDTALKAHNALKAYNALKAQHLSELGIFHQTKARLPDDQFTCTVYMPESKSELSLGGLCNNVSTAGGRR